MPTSTVPAMVNYQYNNNNCSVVIFGTVINNTFNVHQPPGPGEQPAARYGTFEQCMRWWEEQQGQHNGLPEVKKPSQAGAFRDNPGFSRKGWSNSRSRRDNHSNSYQR